MCRGWPCCHNYSATEKPQICRKTTNLYQIASDPQILCWALKWPTSNLQSDLFQTNCPPPPRYFENDDFIQVSSLMKSPRMETHSRFRRKASPSLDDQPPKRSRALTKSTTSNSREVLVKRRVDAYVSYCSLYSIHFPHWTLVFIVVCAS